VTLQSNSCPSLFLSLVLNPSSTIPRSYNKHLYLRVYSGHPTVVTHWHLGITTYWRCIWPISWTLYRKIEKSEHLFAEDIDQLLEEYLHKKYVDFPGVVQSRSEWDNYFGDQDGRNRRRSSADTIEEGDYLRRARREWEEKEFLLDRFRWICAQEDTEGIFNSLSNLNAEANRRPPRPPRQGQASTKKRGSKNNRRRSRLNSNLPVGSLDPITWIRSNPTTTWEPYLPVFEGWD
jgi:hypothetical protein